MIITDREMVSLELSRYVSRHNNANAQDNSLVNQMSDHEFDSILIAGSIPGLSSRDPD